MDLEFGKWREVRLPNRQRAFTTNGGVAPDAATFLKRLASQMSDKKNESCSVVMNFLRCRCSFSLLRSSLLCLRGSQS